MKYIKSTPLNELIWSNYLDGDFNHYMQTSFFDDEQLDIYFYFNDFRFCFFTRENEAGLFFNLYNESTDQDEENIYITDGQFFPLLNKLDKIIAKSGESGACDFLKAYYFNQANKELLKFKNKLEKDLTVKAEIKQAKKIKI